MVFVAGLAGVWCWQFLEEIRAYKGGKEEGAVTSVEVEDGGFIVTESQSGLGWKGL